MGSKFFSVYKAYSADGKLLYVGKSIRLMSRIGEHKCGSAWFKDVSRIDVVHCDSETQMSSVEVEAIKSEKPIYNIIDATLPFEMKRSVTACKKTRRMLAGLLFQNHVRHAIRKSEHVPRRAVTLALFSRFSHKDYKADLHLCRKLDMPLSELEYMNMFNNSRCTS